MSLERGKRNKKLLYAAGLSAGLALGSHIPTEKEKPADDPIARTINELNRGKYAEHDPKGEVIDRRTEPREIANALHFGELEPDPPINDDLATSRLAIDAGANNIEKTRHLHKRKMPRDTHSVKTWNKKNQIDHAIKKVQRSVLNLHETTDRKKKD